MNRFKRYCTAWRRYNRSRGFGIHSPFAYYFVRRVLRERWAYYAYDGLLQHRNYAKGLVSRHNAGKRIISFSNAKMLFRIACYFSPKEMLQIGSTYGVSTMTLLEVSRQACVTFYAGENYCDEIFDKVTETRHDRIIKHGSLQAAIDDYMEKIADKPGFVLVNNVEEQNVSVVSSFAKLISERGGVVVMRNLSRSKVMKQMWASTCLSLGHGMSFTNYRIGIIVGLKHLPRQNYTLWF